MSRKPRGPGKLYEYMGETLSVGQLTYKHSTLDTDVVRARLKSGWRIEKALTTPARTKKRNAA
jgi:hypothetical protein